MFCVVVFFLNVFCCFGVINDYSTNSVGLTIVCWQVSIAVVILCIIILCYYIAVYSFMTLCAYGFTGGSWVMHNGSWVTFCMGHWVMGQCQWPIACSAPHSRTTHTFPRISTTSMTQLGWGGGTAPFVPPWRRHWRTRGQWQHNALPYQYHSLCQSAAAIVEHCWLFVCVSYFWNVWQYWDHYSACRTNCRNHQDHT